MDKSERFKADRLIKLVRGQFEEVIDGQLGQVKLELADALMSGFALFALKEPSLLAFDKRRQEPENLTRLYQIKEIPSDTQLRTILDEVSPEELRGAYQALWTEVKQSGVLSEYEYLQAGYLLSLDGSQYFSSQ